MNICIYIYITWRKNIFVFKTVDNILHFVTCEMKKALPIVTNYINPGYGLSLVDTLWNASSYRQPLEQEGNPMT